MPTDVYMFSPIVKVLIFTQDTFIVKQLNFEQYVNNKNNIGNRYNNKNKKKGEVKKKIAKKKSGDEK